jgi:hypothetical protein
MSCIQHTQIQNNRSLIPTIQQDFAEAMSDYGCIYGNEAFRSK